MLVCMNMLYFISFNGNSFALYIHPLLSDSLTKVNSILTYLSFPTFYRGLMSNYPNLPSLDADESERPNPASDFVKLIRYVPVYYQFHHNM